MYGSACFECTLIPWTKRLLALAWSGGRDSVSPFGLTSGLLCGRTLLFSGRRPPSLLLAVALPPRRIVRAEMRRESNSYPMSCVALRVHVAAIPSHSPVCDAEGVAHQDGGARLTHDRYSADCTGIVREISYNGALQGQGIDTIGHCRSLSPSCHCHIVLQLSVSNKGPYIPI